MRPRLVVTLCLVTLASTSLGGCVVAALAGLGAAGTLAVNSNRFEGDGKVRKAPPAEAAAAPAPAPAAYAEQSAPAPQPASDRAPDETAPSQEGYAQPAPGAPTRLGPPADDGSDAGSGSAIQSQSLPPPGGS